MTAQAATDPSRLPYSGVGSGLAWCDAPEPRAAAVLRSHVVVFRRQAVRPDEAELAALRQWLCTWSQFERPHRLVMGCCADSSRAGRARRLLALTEQLVQCGVPRERLLFTEDWLAPSVRQGEVELPEDIAWLEAVDATLAAQDLLTITSFLESPTQANREIACTTAS